MIADFLNSAVDTKIDHKTPTISEHKPDKLNSILKKEYLSEVADEEVLSATTSKNKKSEMEHKRPRSSMGPYRKAPWNKLSIQEESSIKKQLN